MERLKALRQERNISQQKLADAIGITQQAIYKYEHDLGQPAFYILIQLSKFFHVSIDYLIENPEFDNTFSYSAKTSDGTTIIELDVSPSEYHYLSLFKLLAPETQKSVVHILEVMASAENDTQSGENVPSKNPI